MRVSIHPLALVAVLGVLLIVLPLTLVVVLLFHTNADTGAAVGAILGTFVLGVLAFVWSYWTIQ